jgi:hypothetical protein
MIDLTKGARAGVVEAVWCIPGNHHYLARDDKPLLISCNEHRFALEHDEDLSYVCLWSAGPLPGDAATSAYYTCNPGRNLLDRRAANRSDRG